LSVIAPVIATVVALLSLTGVPNYGRAFLKRDFRVTWEWDHRLTYSNCWNIDISADLAEVILIIV